jgi:uncharacterized membrane protein YfcA
MLRSLVCPYFLKAFAFSAPIGALAGLIGLGGGEFRLPVLMHVIGFGARAAVPLNLVVSLVTLAFALATRSHSLPLSAVAPHLPEIAGLLCGGMASALYGTRLVHRLSDERLVRLIAVLLAALGALLVAEAFLPIRSGAFLPEAAWTRLAAGLAIGAGVGLVASVLGVAGGELLIPALVLVFGTDIKTAGSASLMISIAIVTTSLWRHYAAGALALGRGAQRIAVAMSAGSVVGAVAGGLALAMVPAEALKLLLGAVLIAAAKTMRKQR